MSWRYPNMQELAQKLDYEGGLDYFFHEMRPEDLERTEETSEFIDLWTETWPLVEKLVAMIPDVDPDYDPDDF